MSKTLEQIEAELDGKIPRDVISLREGGAGKKLSYLEGWYVIDRLNKVFGPLGWSKEIVDVRPVVNTTTRGEFPAYLVKVRLEIKMPNDTGGFNYIIKEGYGYGADKSGQNAHELAIKEAVTDALKVAAKDLGMSMGLALYDKTQENVDDGHETSVATKKDQPIHKVDSPAPKSPVAVEGRTSKGVERPKIEEAIRSYLRIADKQKRLTVAEFKIKLKEQHGGDTLAALTEEQLATVLTYLQELTK